MNVYVRELGRALAERGVGVDIFTRRQAADVPDVVEYAPGARVVHIDAGPRRHLDKYEVLDYLPDFACGVQRFRALTGVSYDVVHSHYWLSGRLGLLFADRWNVPLVSMFHTLAQLKNRVAETAAEREHAVRYEIERRTMAGSDRVVAATAIDRQQMLRYYGDDLAPIIREVHAGGGPIPPQVARKLADRLTQPMLTPRELDVLRLMTNGLRNKEIGAELRISEQTTQGHIKSIFSKLNVHDRTEAVTVAIRRGIVHID